MFNGAHPNQGTRLMDRCVIALPYIQNPVWGTLLCFKTNSLGMSLYRTIKIGTMVTIAVLGMTFYRLISCTKF